MAPVRADMGDEDFKGGLFADLFVWDGVRVYAELEDAGQEFYWERMDGGHRSVGEGDGHRDGIWGEGGGRTTYLKGEKGIKLI